MPVAISDDEIYTLDELIKRRASELWDLPSLGYPKEGLTDYEEHSASALDRYVDAAALALQQRGLKPVVSTRVTFAFPIASRCETMKGVIRKRRLRRALLGRELGAIPAHSAE